MDQNNITAENLANIIYRIAAELKNDIPGVIERTVDAFAPKERERIESEAAREAAETAREENFAKLKTQVENMAVGKIFPIGAVYISFNKQEPAELFGGTWRAIASDKFLMTTKSTSGTSGGSISHNHAIGEARVNAYFDHSLSSLMYAEGFATDSGGIYQEYNTNKNAYFNSGLSDSYGIDGSSMAGIKVEGNTWSTNNLPPYITVFMWRRIA